MNADERKAGLTPLFFCLLRIALAGSKDRGNFLNALLSERLLTIQADSPAAEAFNAIERQIQASGFEIIESNPNRGELTGVLFSVVAARLFLGQALTAVSQPLPFFAYPFFVATLVGWAWERFRGAS